jgi:hypothetical protein
MKLRTISKTSHKPSILQKPYKAAPFSMKTPTEKKLNRTL